jgi:hypothetical protein
MNNEDISKWEEIHDVLAVRVNEFRTTTSRRFKTDPDTREGLELD